MSDKTIIPPSPTSEDYRRDQVPDAGDVPHNAQDPFAHFEAWLASARDRELNDPNAMALATVDADGLPDVRMVLLKGIDEQSFVFYTNFESSKSAQLQTSGKAALLFHWKSLRRQVRVRGTVSRVSPEAADTYFASRARDSQIGAWASDQSKPLTDRFALEKRVAALTVKFGVGPVPRPPHWGGFRLSPQSFEFWRDRPFRLHERLVFQRVEQGWITQHLYP